MQLRTGCPHCGAMGSFNVTVSNGTSPQTCVKCRKGFRLVMKNGSIWDVQKT